MENKIYNKFLGWSQYTKDEFDKLSKVEKFGRLFFVRELDESGETKTASIYFGNRLYAEVNSDAKEIEMINNIIESLGEMVDSNGHFIRFSIEDHEILGQDSVNNATDAIVALENAILAEVSKRKKDINAVEEKVDNLTKRVNNLEDRMDYEDLLHTVTGNDVEELTEEEVKEIAKAELQNVAENGGNILMQADVEANTLIKQ